MPARAGHLSFIMAVLFAALNSIALADEFPAAPGSWTTTWLGNSIAGSVDHVPQRITGFFVAEDGTIWTNTEWDEGFGEVSRFDRDGRLTGTAGHTHGWGYDGGNAVTANDRYVYFSQKIENERGHLVDPMRWPAKGKVWYGVSRRLRADLKKGVTFDGAKGDTRADNLVPSLLLVSEVDELRRKSHSRADEIMPTGITALAATPTRLFVADAIDGSIQVFDAETMAPAAQWTDLPGVWAMAMDHASHLWVARTSIDKPASADQHATITQLDDSGRPMPGGFQLPAGVRPTGLAFDPEGRLFVADGGPGACILVFDPQKPGVVLRTIGSSLFAGVGPEVGRVGPGKFAEISGIGIDADGSLYVASGTSGAVLEKYDINGIRKWIRYALVFVDNCSMDPLTGDFYSSEEHFSFDWTKTTPGSEWGFVGKTFDPQRYPDDVRTAHEHQPLMRRLNNGQLYAFTSDQTASGLYVYRFDPAMTGEVAIPSACITKGTIHNRNTPAAGQFIWHDSNGDGRFDTDEITQRSDHARDLGDGCWGWWADEAGDIWQTVNGGPAEAGLRHFPLGGFDAHGNPMYSFDTMQVTPIPSPFQSKVNQGLERVVYRNDRDEMYLGGFAADTPNDGMWGAFRVLARYDHWRSGNRAAKWVLKLPWDVKSHGKPSAIPIGFAVAGDYIFVVGVTSDARVHVFSASDGTVVGDIIPNNGLFTVADTGWVDIRPFGIQAAVRPDGSYAITVEEDWKAKTVLYRWTPPTTAVQQVPAQ